MKKTKIAWTETTWNPITGCSKCSAGCQNCYAEKIARRLQAMGIEKYKNGFTVTLHENALDEPLSLKGQHTIFVCSMSDLFHKDVPFSFIDKIMETIRLTPQHTYQLLTKRADRMAEYFLQHDVPKNAMLGVTCECQKAKGRIGSLRKIKTDCVKFLSCEPLVEDLGELDLQGIDWVIVGGESGNKARAMKKEWAQNIQSQCKVQGIPFFFKQWGTWGEDGIKRNKKANGCLLDGKIIQEYPRGIKQ